MVKRAVLAGAMLVWATGAYGHDCSSASDCARVIQCSGLLAALLALLVGTAAAATPEKKSDPCERAAALLRALLATMAITALIALLAIAAVVVFNIPASAIFGLGGVVLLGLIAILLALYYRAAQECRNKPVA